MENITLITAITGLAFGLLGAVLGILNTWHAYERDRVRLVVRPIYVVTPHSAPRLAIEVINVGHVAVTVTEVGLTLRDKSTKFALLPALAGGGHLPQRLEPRALLTALTQAGVEDHPAVRQARRAYASTACRCRFTGTSATLRGIILKARAAAP